MFLISFLGGDGSSGFGLRSKEAGGEAEIGGEAGGDEGGFDLGVRDLKAEGPVGECMEDAMDVFKDDEEGKVGDIRE